VILLPYFYKHKEILVTSKFTAVIVLSDSGPMSVFFWRGGFLSEVKYVSGHRLSHGRCVVDNTNRRLNRLSIEAPSRVRQIAHKSKQHFVAWITAQTFIDAEKQTETATHSNTALTLMSFKLRFHQYFCQRKDAVVAKSLCRRFRFWLRLIRFLHGLCQWRI